MPVPVDVLLFVAVFAPLAGFVLSTVGGPGKALAPLATAISTAAWFGLLVADEAPSFQRLAPDSLAVAASLGVALLATGLLAASAPPVTGAVATALMVGLSMTTPSGAPSALALSVGVVAAIVLAVLIGNGGTPANVTAPPAVAAATLVIATLVLHDQTGSYNFGAAGVAGWVTRLLLAAAAVMLVGVAAASGSGKLAPLTLLLPVGLACGFHVAPFVDGRPLIVIGLAALAVFAASNPARFPVDPAAASVALWAFVAAILPMASAGEARAGSLLLASAAVLIVAVGHPLAVVAAVPGGLTIIHALTGSLDGWAVFVAVGLAATVILLATQLVPGAAVPRFGWFGWAAAGLAAWLVVAPRTWTWAGGGAVPAYDEGIAIAVGAGLLVAAAVGVAARRGARATSG